MIDPNAVALLIRPPQLNSQVGSLRGACRTVALAGGASTAAQDIFAAPLDPLRDFEGLYFRFQASVAFNIAFGELAAMAAATASDWPCQANTIYDVIVHPSAEGGEGSRYFRVFSAAAGTFYWYLG